MSYTICVLNILVMKLIRVFISRILTTFLDISTVHPGCLKNGKISLENPGSREIIC